MLCDLRDAGKRADQHHRFRIQHRPGIGNTRGLQGVTMNMHEGDQHGSVRLPKMGRVTSICRKLRLIFKKENTAPGKRDPGPCLEGEMTSPNCLMAGPVSTLPATQSQYIQEPLGLVLFAENAVLLLFQLTKIGIRVIFFFLETGLEAWNRA